MHINEKLYITCKPESRLSHINFTKSGNRAVVPSVEIERCSIRRKVLTDYIYEQYIVLKETSVVTGIQRVGSEQASLVLNVGLK